MQRCTRGARKAEFYLHSIHLFHPPIPRQCQDKLSSTGSFQALLEKLFWIFMHLQDELHNPWRWWAPLQNAQKNWALLTYHYCSLHFFTNSTSCPKSSPTSHCSNLKLGPGFLLQHRFVAFNSKPSITTVHDRKTCSTGNVHLFLTLPPGVFFLLPPKQYSLGTSA